MNLERLRSIIIGKSKVILPFSVSISALARIVWVVKLGGTSCTIVPSDTSERT